MGNRSAITFVRPADVCVATPVGRNAAQSGFAALLGFAAQQSAAAQLGFAAQQSAAAQLGFAVQQSACALRKQHRAGSEPH
jgi:hypothetical protein